MNKKKNFIYKAISNIFVTLVLILAFLLVGIKAFGFQIYTILSGSMEPTYHVGSLIYIKPISEKDIKVDDVITFKLSEKTVATHRIIEVIKEDGETLYRTKGDANETEDGKLTPYKDVLGKVEFSIPILGYISHYMEKPIGRITVLLIGVTAIVLLYMLENLTGTKEVKKVVKKNEEKVSSDNS